MCKWVFPWPSQAKELPKTSESTTHPGPLIQRNSITRCAITSAVGRKDDALETEKLEVSVKNPSQDVPLGEELL
jgi:hypothetical protein